MTTSPLTVWHILEHTVERRGTIFVAACELLWRAVCDSDVEFGGVPEFCIAGLAVCFAVSALGVLKWCWISGLASLLAFLSEVFEVMAVKEITLPPGQLSCLREVSCSLLRNVGACTVGVGQSRFSTGWSCRYLLLECHAISGEASERGSWPLVKHRGKVSIMPATSLSSCWAARSAYFTAFPRHSKNSRGTRRSLRASSRTKEVRGSQS